VRTLYCAVDTTGRFLFREPIIYTEQPHLARLAWVVADDDQVTSEWCKLIKPQNHWIYEDDAIVAHGITPERAYAEGIPLEQAMARFIGALDDVDRFCSFNVDFGRKVLERSAFECRLGWQHLFNGKTMACAMRRATDIVRIPRMAPGGGWNWPKLAAAYEFFSDGEELPSLEMNPIERGIALARCVCVIDRGIIDHGITNAHRSNPYE
jgi:hypothetical protein